MALVYRAKNSRDGNYINITVVEHAGAITVTFVTMPSPFANTNTYFFVKLALTSKLDESYKRVIYGNSKYVHEIDSMRVPTQVEKLQVNGWIKKIVDTLTDKNLNKIEKDFILTEIFYTLQYNINLILT